MKKLFILSVTFILFFACGNSKETVKETVKESTNNTADESTPSTNQNSEPEAETKIEDLTTIQWLDFETAIEKNSKHKKFIFIDVYTKWCGWCKKMDATTFKNPDVVKYMNTYFYAVKMDAESKEPIPYKGKLYEWKSYGRAGYNTLAVSLLDSQMSFPSFVVLSKKETKLGKIIGYRDANGMMSELKKYVGK